MKKTLAILFTVMVAVAIVIDAIYIVPYTL